MQSKVSENTANEQIVDPVTAVSAPVKHRRRLLAAMVGGAGATIWQKPIIDSVLLPAHAQTSVGVTAGASASETDGGTTTSSGASPVDSSSGGSSGGGAGANPTLTLEAATYTSNTLESGACVEDCDAPEMLVMIDLYDSDGVRLGSYEYAIAISAPQCVSIDVSSEIFGLSEWPEGAMFAIAASVADCGLLESTSGFFTDVKGEESSSSSSSSSSEATDSTKDD